MSKPVLRNFRWIKTHLFILYSVYSHSSLHRGLDVLIIFNVVLFSLSLALLRLFGGGTHGLDSLISEQALPSE